MKHYKISQQTLESLINYLASRPYNEVYQGIQTLQTLEEITDAPVTVQE